MTTEHPFDIAIVGNGASGTLVAIHLLHAASSPLRIALLGSGTLGQGIAYATPYAEHLLNVSAARMSAFEDAADDFVNFLAAGGATGASNEIGERYAQRRQYGAYLRDRLRRARATSRATLELIADRAVACDGGGERSLVLALASGRTLRAGEVVLALGNAAKPLPLSPDDALPAGSVLAAWDYSAIETIDRDADVTVVGSGLSMVDVALSLSDNGHRGALHVLSRNALLPLPHAGAYRCVAFNAETLEPLSLRERMRVLRHEAAVAAQAGLRWQSLMNTLRPHVRALWQTLSCEDQRRFQRHVARYWDVHRHRIAPEVDAILSQLRSRGQLRLHRGRLASVRLEAGRLQVAADARDGSRVDWRCDRLINAVGVELHVARMGHALLDDLSAKGRIPPGPHAIGIDTDDAGAVRGIDGELQPQLSVIGSLRLGSLLESIAIPDLRKDAQALAARLLAASNYGTPRANAR